MRNEQIDYLKLLRFVFFAFFRLWKLIAKYKNDKLIHLIILVLCFLHLQYLTKQNTALREVNDTRLKIYENIEISIQDLEKQNHRLNVESTNLKRVNKTYVFISH